jgi:succinate dehydrogenase / fumarate reductase cytochrome b subunit
MAVSGVILIGFVIGHLVGNLQVFQEPDHLNGYAQFLRSLGALLWVARLVIIAAVVVHVWAATMLTLENKKARGTDYGFQNTIRATLASRTMRLTGYVVLGFLLFHLAHFTWGLAQTDTYKENIKHYTMQGDYRVAGFLVVKAGTEVLDVHTMVIRGFQNSLVSLFYIVAVGLLSFHLLHGFDSLFQTLGLRSEKWSGALRKIAVVFCAAYFFFNLMIPLSVLDGAIKPHAATVTAATK